MSGLARLGSARLDPRGFCGAASWPAIRELEDGRDVTGCFLVVEKHRKETKALKPYLHLVLGDRSGMIDAKVWDYADRFDGMFGAEDVIGVRGRTSLYNGKLEMTVTALEPLVVGDDDLALFLPASPRDRGVMGKELDQLVESVGHGGLRTLLERCVGRRSTLGRQYRLHPAAKKNHHAYIGGLMEHSISVARACDRLCAPWAT